MITMYEENGKKLWRVRVLVRGQDRKQIVRKRKGIPNEREAKRIEFEFKNELKLVLETEACHTWESWFKECMKRMSLYSKRSTIMNYEARINRWIPKEWNSKLLTEITTEEVHRVIFEHIGDKLMSNGREKVWKMTRRIFEMALNEGIITKNPAAAFKVKGVAQEQQVLTAIEAQRLLDESRNANHRFWSVWTFALMSGMRSGEMYAIRWTDVDLNAGNLSIT